MPSLPEELDLKELERKAYTFTYTDAVKMRDDIHRLIRKTGGRVYPVPSNSAVIFCVAWGLMQEDDEDSGSLATFKISGRAVHNTLWPSLHPNDPSIFELRRLLLEKNGHQKLANKWNEIKKEPEPSGTSRWNRLLADDDE